MSIDFKKFRIALLHTTERLRTVPYFFINFNKWAMCNEKWEIILVFLFVHQLWIVLQSLIHFVTAPFAQGSLFNCASIMNSWFRIFKKTIDKSKSLVYNKCRHEVNLWRLAYWSVKKITVLHPATENGYFTFIWKIIINIIVKTNILSNLFMKSPPFYREC